jgi:SAM-dependent methyltransferase
MSCFFCGSKNYLKVLDKENTLIWLNSFEAAANSIEKYKCVLNQCKECGHVYQPVNNDLRKILEEIYLSTRAQASTPMGKGNWGCQRAEAFLKKIDFKGCNYILEIGCGDGYVLKELKNKGFNKLVGIDPSLDRTEEKDGILFLSDFANESLRFPQKFDLIFSGWSFEHIEDINGVMKFCRNNLAEKGRLFFSVPNAECQLKNGDPALFLHQHIHYFTKNSLTCLLLKNGFQITSMISTKDDFSVTAELGGQNNSFYSQVDFYNNYQEKMRIVLSRVRNILKKNNVVVHGANQSLSNILNWLNEDFDFALVDNDSTKHGKYFFSKFVHSLADIDLKEYDTVLILPMFFFEAIKIDYINRGFTGKIEGVIEEEVVLPSR